jgi:hypothetical protein
VDADVDREGHADAADAADGVPGEVLPGRIAEPRGVEALLDGADGERRAEAEQNRSAWRRRSLSVW